VRFERTLDAPVAAVWRALTDPAELPEWLAEGTIDLHVGGEVVLRFDDGEARGTVTELEPGTVLAYSWREGDDHESHVRFQLDVVGDGTHLTLVHTRLPAPSAPGFGAGWHHHLDLLEALTTGAGAPAEWSRERFHELRTEYERR
jgi:uncharacterized protein YndB with AHSA1/START domain